MKKANDYRPVSCNDGWQIRSVSTGDVIYHNGAPALFRSKREAKIEADFQNKSFGGKIAAFFKGDPALW